MFKIEKKGVDPYYLNKAEPIINIEWRDDKFISHKISLNELEIYKKNDKEFMNKISNIILTYNTTLGKIILSLHYISLENIFISFKHYYPLCEYFETDKIISFYLRKTEVFSDNYDDRIYSKIYNIKFKSNSPTFLLLNQNKLLKFFNKK